jgi:DNA recombination protein RmuC
MEIYIFIVLVIVVLLQIFLITKLKSSDSNKSLSDLERRLKEEFSISRKESNETSTQNRRELSENLDRFNKTVTQRFDKLGETVEQRLDKIQRNNTEQLEKMRQTVDEKLQTTLEKRLTSSFKTVSENLERVQKGLGEMQHLASGVGDLKKVLSNVKTRGSWGEVQLSSLLEQLLSNEQYEQNVATKKGSSDRVEFAIKIPNKEDGELLLPIDAKLPLDRYERLIQASEAADKDMLAVAIKELLQQIQSEAKKISEKYIDPPHTTDFAIMYLPVEGLFAEVVRQVSFVAKLQSELRIVIAGPTTISALLNALQMGFRTLAIQKRTGEVWSLLGEVQKHFGVFSDLLSQTQKKLQEASNKLDSASAKSRTIESKLNKVQKLNTAENTNLLELKN